MVGNSSYGTGERVSRRKVIKYIIAGGIVTAGALITGNYLSQPSQRDESEEFAPNLGRRKTESSVTSESTSSVRQYITTTTATPTREGTRTAEILKFSAYEFHRQLYKEAAMEAARKGGISANEFSSGVNVWDENKGKRVQWISEFVKAEATGDVYKAYFDPFGDMPGVSYSDRRIVVTLPSNQKEILSKMEEGMLVSFSGQLKEFRDLEKQVYGIIPLINRNIYLENGNIVSTDSPLSLTKVMPDKGAELPPGLSFGESVNIGGIRLTYDKVPYKLFAEDPQTDGVLWVKSEPIIKGYKFNFKKMAVDSDLLYVYEGLVYRTGFGVFRLTGADFWHQK